MSKLFRSLLMILMLFSWIWISLLCSVIFFEPFFTTSMRISTWPGIVKFPTTMKGVRKMLYFTGLKCVGKRKWELSPFGVTVMWASWNFLLKVRWTLHLQVPNCSFLILISVRWQVFASVNFPDTSFTDLPAKNKN